MQTYQMRTLAMDMNARLINAHMGNHDFNMPISSSFRLAMFDENTHEIYTTTHIRDIDFKNKLYDIADKSYYIDAGALMHKGVKFVVVEGVSSSLIKEQSFQKAMVGFLIFMFLIMVVGYFLARIFLRPIKQSMDMMEKFIKDTTHELNTPITALMMSVGKLLKTKSYDEQALKRVSISTKNIYETYHSLTYVTFDTLDTRHDEKCDLCEVMHKSRQYFNELLESKHLHLEMHCEPYFVYMDKEMAQRIVNNLLSNAIKYTHKDKHIRLHLHEGILEIHDEGIGIEEEQISRIYERYHRATDFTGGFGVGLSIIKHICEIYGIVLDVKSRLGEGTSFILSFKKIHYNETKG